MGPPLRLPSDFPVRGGEVGGVGCRNGPHRGVSPPPARFLFLDRTGWDGVFLRSRAALRMLGGVSVRISAAGASLGKRRQLKRACAPRYAPLAHLPRLAQQQPNGGSQALRSCAGAWPEIRHAPQERLRGGCARERCSARPRAHRSGSHRSRPAWHPTAPRTWQHSVLQVTLPCARSPRLGRPSHRSREGSVDGSRQELWGVAGIKEGRAGRAWEGSGTSAPRAAAILHRAQCLVLLLEWGMGPFVIGCCMPWDGGRKHDRNRDLA